MGQQINQYAVEATELDDNDFLDIDKDLGGGNYQTNKIKAETVRAAMFSGQWSQTNDITVSGINFMTPLTGSGVGSLTVPANGFKVGNTFHFKIGGQITAANNQTIEFHVMAGSVLLADSSVLTLPGITNLAWEMEIDFTVRAIGAAGVAQIVTTGDFVYNKNASNAVEGEHFFDINSTTFDTTISNTLVIKCAWGSTNPTNSIKCRQGYLLKIM
jgi:hypothetical protein